MYFAILIQSKTCEQRYIHLKRGQGHHQDFDIDIIH
jgi:hypothetical protein